jgi:hypothetical protein
MSLTYAMKQEETLKRCLLVQRKLILILDLDNTLLHSFQYNGFINDPNYFGLIDFQRNIY